MLVYNIVIMTICTGDHIPSQDAAFGNNPLGTPHFRDWFHTLRISFMVGEEWHFEGPFCCPLPVL